MYVYPYAYLMAAPAGLDELRPTKWLVSRLQRCWHSRCRSRRVEPMKRESSSAKQFSTNVTKTQCRQPAITAEHVRALRVFFRARSPTDYQDLTQQTLLECVRSIDRFRGESSFCTWLLSIARHQWYAYLRRAQRARELVSTASGVFGLRSFPSSEAQCTQCDERHAQALDTAMRALPPGMRSVLELSIWQGWTQPEIARALCIPVGTVASRLRLAKAKLRCSVPDVGHEPCEDSSLECVRCARSSFETRSDGDRSGASAH